MYKLVLQGEIPTKKNRQRIGVSKNGRPLIYKPQVVKDFENMVAQEVMVQKVRKIYGPVELSVLYVYGKHEPDLDGTITSIMDALQYAGVFEDDAQVVRIHDCEKRKSASKEDMPGAIIEINATI